MQKSQKMWKMFFLHFLAIFALFKFQKDLIFGIFILDLAPKWLLDEFIINFIYFEINKIYYHLNFWGFFYKYSKIS